VGSVYEICPTREPPERDSALASQAPGLRTPDIQNDGHTITMKGEDEGIE
jgi:hypothetical protein